MAFRDDLTAARARAEALERRVRELEQEIARARGEVAERPAPEIERLLEEARRDAREAQATARQSERRVGWTFLGGLWFLARLVFRAAILVVGAVVVWGGATEIRDAGRHRPAVPLLLSMESLDGRAPRGLARISDAVCLLPDLTYLGSMGGESSPDCYFPLVSRSEWAALRRAHGSRAGFPVFEARRIRILVARSCREIESKFGPVLVSHGQVPRRCAMTGDLEPLRRADAATRAFVRREYRGVRDGVLLLRAWTEDRPSSGFGAFLVLAGLALFVWMAVRLAQTVRAVL